MFVLWVQYTCIGKKGQRSKSISMVYFIIWYGACLKLLVQMFHTGPEPPLPSQTKKFFCNA